jgi:very-short-patch-repair endonuclease
MGSARSRWASAHSVSSRPDGVPGFALTRTGRAALLVSGRGGGLARVTPPALWVAAPGTPPGREVLMVARRELLHDRAREMRHSPTASEERLWQRLRGSRLGVAFRRQVVVGGYIADFAASSVRLVVEVDGGCHVGRERNDAKRDARLARAGWRVVKVAGDMPVEEAVARIVAALEG